MSITLVEKDKIVAKLDESIPVMIHKWLKPPTSDEFRDQLLELKEIYLTHRDKYENLMWLADTQSLGELTYEDEKWLEEVWERELFVNAGVKVHAVILSDDIYADYSMEKFKMMTDKKYAETGIRLGVFMDEESAYEWMKSIK